MVADTHLREAIGNHEPADEGDQINPQLQPWKLTGDASSRRPSTSERQTRKDLTQTRRTRPASHHHCAATPTSPKPGQGRPPTDPCRPRPAPPQRQARSRPRPPEPATDALPRRTCRQARSASRHDRPHQPLAAPAAPRTGAASDAQPVAPPSRAAPTPRRRAAAPPRPGTTRHLDPAALAHAKAAGKGNEEASPPPASARFRPAAPSGSGEGGGGGGERSWRQRGRVPPVASRGASGREGASDLRPLPKMY